MRVEARYLLHPEKKIAVIEAAQAHGLKLLTEAQRNAMAATSYGVGELINAALSESKAQNIPLENLIIAVGGSASTDGGFGALQALGVTFRDAHGEAITQPLSGESLATVQEIGWPGQWPYPGKITIATDVITPLLGPDGTATLFAPQKGATPADCERLEHNLTAAAQQLSTVTGKDYPNFPGVGAAGGLAYGLCHLPRSGILSGSDWIADLLQLKSRIQQARLIITGEGRLDATTFSGKATSNLMLWAKDTPLWFLCGQLERGLTLPANVHVSPLANGEEESLTLALRHPETALQNTLAAHWPAVREMLSL
jgi:glycerate kinase